MLPCLHTQGTFVLPHVPDVHCCSICSVPVFSPVESRSMEPLSKRPHVDCEPVEPRLVSCCAWSRGPLMSLHSASCPLHVSASPSRHAL